MVLAKSAKTVEAVEGVKEPPEWIILPYLGCTAARTSQIPEKMVEYIESIKTEMESQLVLELCISRFVGHPSTSPVDGQLVLRG